MEILNKNIFITGATGVVGRELVPAIMSFAGNFKVTLGVRNVEKAKEQFAAYSTLDFRYFDIQNASSFDDALFGMDTIFLLRPPSITNIKRFFTPLMESIVSVGIKEIVFLSVQGAEKSSVIPHHRIEKRIEDSGIPYVFLRPSYFMQNLTTTLAKDIRINQEIFLPAGHGIFNWVDVKDVAQATAIILLNFHQYKNQALELTGDENLTFYEAAKILSNVLGRTILFPNPNVFAFYDRQQKQGMAPAKIMVMVLLHSLARFRNVPNITNHIHEITGTPPTRLTAFCEREKLIWT